MHGLRQAPQDPGDMIRKLWFVGTTPIFDWGTWKRGVDRQFCNSCINFRTKCRKNSGIIVVLPNTDSKPMIHSATTPARLRHGVQEKHLHARVQQRHRTHDTGLMRREKRETCQQVPIAVLILRRIPSDGCQLARSEAGYFADDIKYRVSEGMRRGRASQVRQKTGEGCPR